MYLYWKIGIGLAQIWCQSFEQFVKSGATIARYTVEHILKDYPIGHNTVISQETWSLATGSNSLKCRTLCQEYVVLQDRQFLMAVPSGDVSLYYTIPV